MTNYSSYECPGELLAQANRNTPIRTAVVAVDSKDVLEAALRSFELNLIEPILIGDMSNIERLASRVGFDISRISRIAADGDESAIACAIDMANSGAISAIMKGNCPTDMLLRALLKSKSTILCSRQLSHVFHLTIPKSDRVLFVTDAAVNVAPTTEDLIGIVHNVCDLLAALDYVCPKVALLSATERVNESIESTVRASAIVNLARCGEFPGRVIEGPMAYDIAMSKESALAKKYTGSICGDADVLVVPNIETGNALYKQTVHFLRATAAGIVLGAHIPIILTSRAESVAARIASTALANIYHSYSLGLNGGK